MTPLLRLRPQIPDDVLKITGRIVRDNPAAAVRFTNRLPRTLLRLAAMPGIGSPKRFRDKRLTEIRTWFIRGFPNHLICYRPIPDGIEVLAVVHGARNLPKLLAGRVV